ncbi:hypothetical protein [Streptomyces sp. PAM3C]|uniref:hypothetical protein n=1 Tax=Streptomyces sp. PAM3C TaxID=2847300 RepID=UPI001C1E3F11|nr:hypothetical protein [Streptomyces sp. PAM3C]MBU5943272.1 hypothetical protein [Streptomyces sp. PAM3C]
MDHGEVIPEREVSGLVVTRVGSVEASTAATLPWVVLDGTGRPITPASEFLRELLAYGNTMASCRSYAFDLLRWFRFLAAVDVEWNRAKRVDVRDFVLPVPFSAPAAGHLSQPDPRAPDRPCAAGRHRRRRRDTAEVHAARFPQNLLYGDEGRPRQRQGHHSGSSRNLTGRGGAIHDLTGLGDHRRTIRT